MCVYNVLLDVCIYIYIYIYIHTCIHAYMSKHMTSVGVTILLPPHGVDGGIVVGGRRSEPSGEGLMRHFVRLVVITIIIIIIAIIGVVSVHVIVYVFVYVVRCLAHFRCLY